MRLSLLLTTALVLSVSCRGQTTALEGPPAHYVELHALLGRPEGFLAGGLADLDAPAGGSDAVGRTRAWIGWLDSDGRILRHRTLAPDRTVRDLVDLGEGRFLACGPGWYGTFEADGSARELFRGPEKWRSAAAGADGGILLAGDAPDGSAIGRRLTGRGEARGTFDVEPGPSTARQVAPAHGGGWIVAGWRWEDERAEAFVQRLDATGRIEWTDVFDLDRGGAAHAVCAVDGGYVVAGTTGVGGDGADQIGWVRLLDEAGTVVWLRRLRRGENAGLCIGLGDSVVVLGKRPDEAGWPGEGWFYRLRLEDGSVRGELALPGRHPLAVARRPGGGLLAGGLGTGGAWLEVLDPGR